MAWLLSGKKAFFLASAAPPWCRRALRLGLDIGFLTSMVKY